LRSENYYHPDLLQISILFCFVFFWVFVFFLGFFFGPDFHHLGTKHKSIKATHSNDLGEKNVAKSPDFEGKVYDITIFRLLGSQHVAKIS